MNFRIDAAARTHVGLVRGNNEDNFYLCGKIREDVDLSEDSHCCRVNDSRVLAAVADGMGGEALGEVASLMAVQALEPCAFEKVQQQALASGIRANQRICHRMDQENGRHIGSTLVALYIDAGKALCGNLGDSRGYLYRENTLMRLTKDHTRAQRMVSMGILSPEQAEVHPSRNELTRYLGIPEEEMQPELDFGEPVELQQGDEFLLCSDGLTDMLSEQQITGLLADSWEPEQQAQSLVDAALQAGGRDNVTVVLLRILKDEQPQADAHPGVTGKNDESLFCRLKKFFGKQKT